MQDERKRHVLHELNLKLGHDLKDLEKIYEIKEELLTRKRELEKSLSLANCEVPSKVYAAVTRAQEASERIRDYREKTTSICEKNEDFLKNLQPVTEALMPFVDQIRCLEASKEYLEVLESVNSLSKDLETCTDSEQSILHLQCLYDLKTKHNTGHRGTYISDVAHYWYNILKEKFSMDFDVCLKQVQWPFTSTTMSLTKNISQDSLTKLKQVASFLLQIQMPHSLKADNMLNDTTEQGQCLPIRLMLKPLKKRFAFHFSGNRKTNRLDRPEWFMTQILSWLRDHLAFIENNLQPVIDDLQMDIDAQNEFAAGLLVLVVDKLDSLLTTVIGDDVFFSHAVDECLGFEKELRNLIGELPPTESTVPRVTSVLTEAKYIQRWLDVEKKFAIQKIDEMLNGDEWLQVLGGDIADGSSAQGIPQGADWLISLLNTVHERYCILPQPGHRLQFLDLQTELCNDLRVRLTQLIGEEVNSECEGGRGLEGSAPRLLSLLNVAHHLRKALVDWSHSVPYLQLYYYKRQFKHFTEQQHMSIPDLDTTPKLPSAFKTQRNRGSSISLLQVEAEARQLAQLEVEHLQQDILPLDIVTEESDMDLRMNFLEDNDPEAGVFEDIPALLEDLVDGTCKLISDDLVLEVKAASRDYRKQQWHCLPETTDWRCRSLSAALCGALGALSSRLLRLHSSLTPELFAPLTRAVAREIDDFIFDEVVKECLWGPGGTQQFHFDMTRNLMPIFAQYTTSIDGYLPKIKESCILLNLLLGSALLLKGVLNEVMDHTLEEDSAHRALSELAIRHLSIEDVLRVLNQRTDINLSRQYTL